MRRPAIVIMVACLYWLVAALTIAGGIFLGMMSGCCGAADTAAAPGPIFAGFAVATIPCATGVALFNGAKRHWVLGLGALLPVAFLVLGFVSMDAGSLVVPFAVGWGILFWVTRTKTWRTWLTYRESHKMLPYSTRSRLP